MMGVPFTHDDDETMLRLRVSGKTYREIGEAVGRSENSVTKRINRLGFDKRIVGIEFTEPQIVAIKLARSRGWSYERIARKIGIDAQEVRIAMVL